MGLKTKDAFIHIGIPSNGSGMSSGEIDFAIEGRISEICKNKLHKKEIIITLDALKRIIEKSY